ncbi:MAG: bifunctional methylenetetrahydrofolate dehydrogenase/methenyltetrahydrofolate cyclohydrolase FolD [Anaerolineales bacterium]
MTAKIIDGKSIAAEIRAEVAAGVAALTRRGGPVPGLATVLVGENPASATYLRAKRTAAAEVGIATFDHQLSGVSTQQEVEAFVAELGEDRRVHGILVQLPLPSGLDEQSVLARIRIEKDVDGFHPINLGRLAMKGGDPLFVPCTPAGCLTLLKRAGAQLEGSRAVVLGRSNIVGMPVALLLIKHDATVTVCHSRTQDLVEICRQADVLIAAIGQPELVRGDWIRPGATVIDVGINQIADPSAKRGYRVVGDVAFQEALQVAGAITPVPGGVGPMTVAGLLQNTLRAAELAHSRSAS